MDKISLDIQATTDTIVKFTANKTLTRGSHQFNNIDEAKNSPLAQQLFHLPFVKRVLFSANFIALERFSIVEWKDVQEEVKEQLEDYTVSVIIWDKYLSIYLQYCKCPNLGQIFIYLPALL